MIRGLIAAAAALGLASCAVAPAGEPSTGGSAPAPARVSGGGGGPVARALAARDRPEDAAAEDASRMAAELLAFSGVEPGDKVLDVGALTGYSSWLLSGLVGPEGHVIAQNPPNWVDDFEPVAPAMARLGDTRANASPLVTPFDVLVGEAGSFDAVYSSLVYHDIAYLDVDRGVMNRRIYELLKPGGIYLVVDHRAEAGSGLRDVQSLHRIDPAVVRREVENAGFTLDAEADFLTRPEDDLTKNVFDDAVRGRTSQFVYRFVKPAS